MKVEELCDNTNEIVDGECCDPSEEEEFCDESDFLSALDYLEQLLLVMEDIHVQNGRIVKIPTEMLDLMEEVAVFLDQFEGEKA